MLRHSVILVPRLEFAPPSVERPVRHLHAAVAALHKDRPVIPAPNIVRRVVKQAETPHPAAAQECLDPRMQRRGCIDAHLRLLRDRGTEGCVTLRKLAQPPLPQILPVWPGNPNCLLRLPFGGPAQVISAERCRCHVHFYLSLSRKSFVRIVCTSPRSSKSLLASSLRLPKSPMSMRL